MALIRLTAPLCRELTRELPERPFGVSFWDGGRVEATRQGAPTFRVRSPGALAHFLRAPGTMGLGRAYVEGLLDVDDLDAAFIVVDEWRPPALGLRERARLAGALIAAALPGGIPRRPPLELMLGGQLHSIERDAAAVRYHYDVGNDFFALFLDESMTYSCAIFSRGAATLEQAQASKLDLVATKLGLEEGMEVLDVGCGWGSFAIHAASRYGARVTAVTLSEPQARLARERVRAARLEHLVEIELADYRRLPSRTFDAIASIGMAEHVGDAQIDEYARTLFSLLRPGGRLLNHAIASLDPAHDPHGDTFSTRYVFPDGEPLALSRIELALERADFETTHIEGFRGDYSVTLRHWAERLDANLERALALAGEQRTRVWRLYLRAARHGFDTGHTSVFQVLARRPPSSPRMRAAGTATRAGDAHAPTPAEPAKTAAPI